MFRIRYEAFPLHYSLMRLYLVDYSPEGEAHASPEVMRARYAGVPVFAETAPLQVLDHRHDGHEIDLVLHGSGTMTVDDEPFRLASEGMLFIPAGQRHRLEVDAHLCLFGIEFATELFTDIAREPTHMPLHQMHLGPKLVNDTAQFHRVRILLDECLAEYTHDDACHVAVLRSLGRLVALMVLRMLQHQPDAQPANPTLQRVLEVKAWIDRHLGDPVILSDLARQAGLSTSRFSVLFHQVVGMPPKAYLIQRRLHTAATLLLDSCLPVTSIAAGVGFEDIANFNHAFRRYAGCSPTQYRQQQEPVR